MKNKKFKQLAIMAGGSHYAEVGGDTLKYFMRLVVEDCCNTFTQLEGSHPNQVIVDCILKEYDLK